MSVSYEAEVGAAVMITFLRDLFTVGQREEYDRSSILVMLEMVSCDKELFPRGLGVQIWQMDDLPT